MGKNLSNLLSAWLRDRRRRRNLSAAGAARPAATLACIGLLLGGAVALLLWRSAQGMAAHGMAAPASRVQSLQSVTPGLRFRVPRQAGVHVLPAPGATLLVAQGLQGGPAERVDLCSHPLPLQVGYRFSEVAQQPALRRALLVHEDSRMPAVTISGGSDFQLRWRERDGGGPVRWVGDGPGASMRKLGWLAWQGGALRVSHHASRSCGQGALLVQAFSQRMAPAADGLAEVAAFPERGDPVVLQLPPGAYEVATKPAPAQEDEALFLRLKARGLLRLDADGLIALAPPDLAQWLAAPGTLRATELAPWRGLTPDAEMGALLKRLYRQADGAFLRAQVELFNSERRLLAWRLAQDSPAGIALRLRGAGGGQLQTAGEMPPLAVSLFASLPEGWQPWQRAAHWNAQDEATLELLLPQPASGRETIRLLLAGRLAAASVQGAAVQLAGACTGRGCGASRDVLVLQLRPEAGVRSLVIPVRALDVSRALNPGDQRHRHLRLAGGQLEWQALAPAGASVGSGLARLAGAVGATPIVDRDGRLLWADGSASPAAQAAGLAKLLGLGPEHGGSVSGMLARGASAADAGAARLSLALPLQALAQAVLECQGLRNGVWSGSRCEGGGAPPPERRAALVLLDADNGDILAAAAAGGAAASAGNWREVRDFDRSDPARSPLRWPAWQHDGGAHHSPGSAFKIISALGLELAARNDRSLDAMLAGLPLSGLDAIASQRGFSFRSDSAIYPMAPRAAHVTNYREQSLLRRAESGRLGLAQALAYSVNTWFAWSAELSDRSLLGRPDGGAPGLRELEPGALAALRPLAAAAGMLGFGRAMRLDGGLLPASFGWAPYDALQSTPSRIDPIDSRHELRQMAIGLRMQATPLQMAVAAAAIGSGRVPAPRLLLAVGARSAQPVDAAQLPVRLDRIRAGMKGVIDGGTAAGAFGDAALGAVRPGLYGKTGTAPVSDHEATVWFTGWLEAGSLPGQQHRLAFAVTISHSQLTGGGHAAPVMAAILKTLAAQRAEQKGNPPSIAANGSASAMPR